MKHSGLRLGVSGMSKQLPHPAMTVSTSLRQDDALAGLPAMAAFSNKLLHIHDT